MPFFSFFAYKIPPKNVHTNAEVINMNSVWSETAKKPVFEVQKGDLKTNVLVIGAGLCGILTAYYLRARGVDCLVCEADEICDGATRNTTAKVTVAHGLIYESILCRFGRKIAQGYLRAQSEALEEYRRLSRLYLSLNPLSLFLRSLSGRLKFALL